jgi:KDO2-lipid IV(A) lauroyltransferase
MWLVARLPLAVQFALGSAVGHWYRFARARRHIARTNIALCFPELDERARDELVRQIFTSTGIGAVDRDCVVRRHRAIPRSRDVRRIGRADGCAAARGRGVVLIGAHFATLDLAGALLSQVVELDDFTATTRMR